MTHHCAVLGSTVRAPMHAPLVGPRHARALATVAYRALGRASPPVLLPARVAKALLGHPAPGHCYL
jgi:hypothetical protein